MPTSTVNLTKLLAENSHNGLELATPCTEVDQERDGPD